MFGFGMPRKPPSGQRPAVLCRIHYPAATVAIEIPAIHGDASGIAARMRRDGLAARKVGAEVHVNGSAEFTPR